MLVPEYNGVARNDETSTKTQESQTLLEKGSKNPSQIRNQTVRPKSGIELESNHFVE